MNKEKKIHALKHNCCARLTYDSQQSISYCRVGSLRRQNIRVKKRIFTAINMKSIHSWCITGQSVSRCQNQHTWWRQVIKIRLAGMDMCISIYTVITLKSYITHCRSSNKEQTDCRFVFSAQKNAYSPEIFS